MALAYAEMSTVMPFAGSAYSWISVLFGEGFGWIAGWALLAEYFIAVAFVGSGFSANLQQLLAPLGFQLPNPLNNSFLAMKINCFGRVAKANHTGSQAIRWGATNI